MDDATLSRLFDKIDHIKEDVTDIKVSVAKQPCDVHNERFKSHKAVHKRIWAIILLILAGLIGLAWRSVE